MIYLVSMTSQDFPHLAVLISVSVEKSGPFYNNGKKLKVTGSQRGFFQNDAEKGNFQLFCPTFSSLALMLIQIITVD